MKTENVKINTKESNPIFTDINLTKIPNVSNLLLFFLKDFLYWWYIQMPIFYLKKLERVSLVISDQFSIPLLLTQFFVPWKRHKSLIGYTIGILTKLLYLPIFIPIYLIIISLYLLWIIIWTLLPPTALIFTFISIFITL